MSARAASRLTGLGFTAYRYQAGKMDWFAAGLSREGTEANVPRVADATKRDVPTCGPEERVGDLRGRLRANDRKPIVVVDADRVVLGIVGPDGLTGDPSTAVEDVMDLAPVTFRPNLRIGEMPDYSKKQRVQHALVTTNDGILVGLVEP
jgi:CBS domain-containing protein